MQDDPSAPPKRIMRKCNAYLASIGWMRSAKERRALTAEGEPLPWYSYPAIAFLEGRVQPSWSVFEYGTGMSTLWWAKRVRKVVSCEHDPDWYTEFKGKVPDNVEYHLCRYSKKSDKYSRFIEGQSGTFDVIVIDGKDRPRCALNSIEKLAGDGVLIWDNANVASALDGQAEILNRGFRRIEFDGLSPATTSTNRTAIFYRTANCLKI